MRRPLLAVLALAAVAAVAVAQTRTNTPKAGASDGFQALFNGKSLEGWRIFSDPRREADPNKVWTVKDGEIHCLGTPPGYLITENEYGNYVLKVQWRWPGTPGNSGVFVHVSGPDTIWPRGIEAQLGNGRAGDIWRVGPNQDEFKLTIKGPLDPRSHRHHARIGDKFVKMEEKDKQGRDRYQIEGKSVEKPLGEWNQYEITCQGDTIKLVVNGNVANEGTGAEATKGKILLQSEGAPIQFRNVEIKMLK